MYQTVLSYNFTTVYVMGVIQFDNEIMQYCQELAFIKKTSRSNKFTLLFAIILLFIFALIINGGMTNIWIIEQVWLQNAVIVFKKECGTDLKMQFSSMGN